MTTNNKPNKHINKDDRKGTYHLYWISGPNNRDILTEGYVGVTKQKIEHRLCKHIYDAKENMPDKKMSCYIRENDYNVTIESLYSGTYNECMLLEFYLRPELNIAANTLIGGNSRVRNIDLELDDYPEQFKRFKELKDSRIQDIEKIKKDYMCLHEDAKKIYTNIRRLKYEQSEQSENEQKQNT